MIGIDLEAKDETTIGIFDQGGWQYSFSMKLSKMNAMKLWWICGVKKKMPRKMKKKLKKEIRCDQ